MRHRESFSDGHSSYYSKIPNFFLIYLKQRNSALTKTRCENIIIIRLLDVPVSIDPIYHLCGGGLRQKYVS